MNYFSAADKNFETKSLEKDRVKGYSLLSHTQKKRNKKENLLKKRI